MSSGEKAAKGKAKASSKTKSSKGKEASVYDQRFRGDGVKFKCKLVGSMDVSGARGDAMCAEAIKTLRLQALKSHKESGEHKQRIVMHVTLKGIRIVDDRTQKVQYEHPINKISFITHDPEDKRTFGYVCSQPCTTGHKLYAIKSEKPAGVITGTLYELFQVVFKIRQEAGLAKKVQNSSQVQNSPRVSNGPSLGSPQNSDGIYEVPYKNGNNKQSKPSPNLDHEYAEPIKPSTKNDPHYKVPNSPPLSATQSPQITDNSRASANVNDKLALKSTSNSSPLLNRLQSFDKEPDQVSQASIPDSPFPAHDNSSADLAFFSSSVFDTAPSESGMADTVSVASSADVSMLRSGSVSSNYSDTHSTHSRSNSINQTATTEGSQPGCATTFDDASNVVTKVGESAQVSESESQGDFSVAFPPLHGKEEWDEKKKVEPSTGQETPVDNPDPFASSTNDSERIQPGTSVGFFAESFAAFDSAFGDFEKNSNGDNQVKEDFSSDDPFVHSSVVPEEEVATENSNDLMSETNFAAAFSSDKFTPSHPTTDVMPDDTQSGTNESTVEEKSKPVENSGFSFLWNNSFQESESQADIAQKPLEDESQLSEKLSGSFTWDNAFGDTENASQSVTTESAGTSEAVQFAWSESFNSDDSDVTTKPSPSTATSISWDDAFGAAPAADESSDQPQNDFSWDNAFVIAFSSSSVVEDSSDKAGVLGSDSQPVPQPAAPDNPPAFSESAFMTSSSSQITESISDSLEANESPPVRDPFEEFKISFPLQTTKPEIIMSGETANNSESVSSNVGGDQSATKENLPNEELHGKGAVSLEEMDKTVSEAEDLKSESNAKNDIEEEQMKEERPCELQVQESKLSLSERPVSPTAPPPLPPRPSVSAPPLPARPSSSSSTVSPGKPMSSHLFTESPSSTSPHQGKKGSTKKTPPPPPPRVDLNEKSEVVSSNEKAAFPDPFGSDLFENSNDVSDHKTSDWKASWPRSPELPPKEKAKDPFSDSFFTDFDFPQKPGISKAANDHVDPFATTNSSSDPFPVAFGNEDLFPAFTPAKADVAFGGGDPFQNDMSGSFSTFPSSDPFSDISDPFADKGILTDDPFGDSPSTPHMGESLTLNESLVASDEADSFA